MRSTHAGAAAITCCRIIPGAGAAPFKFYDGANRRHVLRDADGASPFAFAGIANHNDTAMIYDADILGYFMNGGGNAMAGKLAFAPFAANPAASAPTPNIWIWSLSMSNFSNKKDAAWQFLQWASGPDHGLFGATQMDFVNPVRASVWADESFRDRLGKSYPGYVDMHDVSAPGASIKFTAQPLFFDLTTEWAATLQKMVAKEVPVDEGLDQLADSVDRQLKDAGLG